tara:strand:+ start:2701 stop:3600 length:900 start_codon:yes stop_codon:yes gene_type:complete
MVNQYNDIEISEEEKASLSEPEEATQPQQAEEPAEPSQEVNSAESNNAPEDALVEKASEDDGINLDEYDIEVDGETYSAEQIQQWMNDSNNKEAWQKSNTQKAQELSQWNNLIDKINGDEKFRDYMGDFFYDNPEELAKLNLNGEAEGIGINDPMSSNDGMQEPTENQPSDPRLDELDEKVAELQSAEVVKELENDMDTLVQDNKEIFETEQDELNFLEFCVENQVSDLTTGFMLYTWDSLMEQKNHLEKLQGNKEKNQGVIVGTREAGGPEQNAPKAYSNYKDMSIDDPDISKYFNND